MCNKQKWIWYLQNSIVCEPCLKCTYSYFLAEPKCGILSRLRNVHGITWKKCTKSCSTLPFSILSSEHWPLYDHGHWGSVRKWTKFLKSFQISSHVHFFMDLDKNFVIFQNVFMPWENDQLSYGVIKDVSLTKRWVWCQKL